MPKYAVMSDYRLTLSVFVGDAEKKATEIELEVSHPAITVNEWNLYRFYYYW